MASSLQLIAHYTVPSNTADYTFSGIPASYKHLVLKTNDKSTRTDYDFASVNVVINGLTSGYANLRAVTDNVNVNAVTDAPNSSQAAVGFTNASTAGNVANAFAAGEVFFYDYQSTTKQKAILGWGGANNQGTSVRAGVAIYSSRNTTTSPITSIKIFFDSGIIVAGSIYSLYGIKDS